MKSFLCQNSSGDAFLVYADDIWDEDLARRMCRAVGGDVSFWMRRSLEHERMKLRLKMDELMEKTQEMLEIMEGAKNAR